MKKIKFDSNHLLIGIFILVTGILLGITISTGGTFALEGTAMATKTNATSANATSANATSTNATSANATSTNATATNATNANASRTDNILYLNDFSLAVDSVKPGEKVSVKKITTGACNSGMSIQFIDFETDNEFSVNVESMNDNPYFIVPKNVIKGTYTVNGITMIGLNSDNNTFTKCYARIGTPAACSKHDFDVKLTINIDEVKEIKLNKLSLTSNSAKVGEKVNITYETNETLTSIRLFFKGENGTFNVNVFDLDKESYFIVPTTTKSGEYNLVKAILMNEESSIVYEQGDNYSFETKLAVEDNSEKTYIYNNSDINEEIIKKLYADQDANEIFVNIDNNSIISEDLFKAIIGTNKKLIINTNNNQLIFNGKDITKPKSIDATMNTIEITDSEEINSLVNNGIVVDFVSNGNLPGNALVRLKITDMMKNTFGDDKVNIYYYDRVQKGFNTIRENVSAKDGYYEFTISHNSKYILTTTKIDKSLIVTAENNNVVGFRQSNSTYLAILCAALILILIAVVALLTIKNKNKKGKN